MASVAEAKLAQAKHYGEKRRCNFESYISTLNEQFQALNNLTRHGHAGIDESSKVHRLNAGIKTDKLNASKAQIMASRVSQDNFDDAVGLYQDFIAQMRPANDNNEFNVCGFEQGQSGSGTGRGGARGRGGGRCGGRGGGQGRGRGSGRGRGRGRGDVKQKRGGNQGDVKDRHYSPSEHAELDSEQKTKLQSLRVACEGGAKDTKDSDTRQAAQMLTKLLGNVVDKNVSFADAELDKSAENEQDKGNVNRNHSALKKPKRGRD
jgi:hypothetical protein